MVQQQRLPNIVAAPDVGINYHHPIRFLKLLGHTLEVSAHSWLGVSAACIADREGVDSPDAYTC